MKSVMTSVSKPIQRGTLTDTFKIRVDPRQKNFWKETLGELGYGDDLAAYMRYAVDRSIALDMQTKDPNWQKFLNAVSKQAKSILGYELKDSLEGRNTLLKIYSKEPK